MSSCGPPVCGFPLQLVDLGPVLIQGGLASILTSITFAKALVPHKVTFTGLVCHLSGATMQPTILG